MPHAPGTFCWVDLETTDQSAAKTFYASLFGWTFTDVPLGPSGAYTRFQIDGRDAAAAYQQPEIERARGVRSHWNLYIAVDDAGASTARAAELGATILAGPLDVLTQGRMTIAVDPAGAAFYLWQAKDNPGFGVTGEINSFCWGDLHTADRAGAKRFYEGLFGWTIAPGNDKDASTYLHIHAGGRFLGGILPDSHRNPKAPPHWMPYFKTSGLAAALKKAEALGAQVFAPPVSIGGALPVAMLRDPQLAAFALFEG